MIQLAFNFAIPLGLIIIAIIVGTILEQRHFQSIRQREDQFAYLPTMSGKSYPSERAVAHCQVFCGSCVVSIDYFKRLLASLRMIFGGELHAYGSLLDRARREAVLRLKAQCPEADLIVSLRIETSSISKGGNNAVGSTEVLAYGTAIKFAS